MYRCEYVNNGSLLVNVNETFHNNVDTQQLQDVVIMT